MFALMAALLAATLAGCSPAQAPQQPSVTTIPVAAGATIEPGVLTVAVDPSFPPFAGKVRGGGLAGLDIDVASALADRLGLKVRFIEVPRGKMGSRATGKADIGLGGLSTRDIIRQGALPGGVYAFDGPALFSSKAATLTPAGLAGKRLGAQRDSEAWWRLRDRYGSHVAPFGDLREAMDAAKSGTIEVLGADALVGGYIARDFPSVRPVGVIGVHPVEVALLRTDLGLADPVRTALQSMETGGVLAVLRAKWAGPAAAYVFAAGARSATAAPVSNPATSVTAPSATASAAPAGSAASDTAPATSAP